ncbi:hypothetical protein [Actinoallomurus sp. CA-142502]|uniref:hypothetical protein n=1 Tax=Actinoallomurus sp. CA-142502 TaxID=3239885 RepID=UPI003D8C1473
MRRRRLVRRHRLQYPGEQVIDPVQATPEAKAVAGQRPRIGVCAYLTEVSPETLDVNAKLCGVRHSVGGIGPYLE